MVKKYRAYIILALIVLFLDQLSKYLVKHWMISTTGNFLDISYTTNIGSLFSLFDSVGLINIVFILISFLAIGFLIYYAEMEKDFSLGVGLLLGGILGNLFDRLLSGAVVDWINFHFWPVFNLADAGIVCGVILVVYTVMAKDQAGKKKNQK